MRDWAKQRQFNDAQIDEMTDRFRDHWTAATGAGASKANWDSAWRNWVGKEDPRRVRGAVRELHPGTGRQYQQTFADGTPMPWDR